MEGSIRIAKLADKTLITLRGMLDKELAFNLMGIASKTEPPVMLNLRQVPHLTVAGSQAILSFYQLHQQKPEIQEANEDVVSLLNLTGAGRYINLLPNPNDNNLDTAQD
ncbi:MAG: hypothetical protein ACPGSM_05775 [Thiolinea sp.]